MNEFAGNQRAYTESGPWDRLGSVLRITVAVVFLAITVAFFATAQNGLISAGDISAVTPAVAGTPAQTTAAGTPAQATAAGN